MNNNDLRKEYELYFDFLNETFLSDYLDGKIFIEKEGLIKEYSLAKAKEGIRLTISFQEKISLKASFVLAGQEMKNRTQNLVGELTYRFILADQTLPDSDSKKEKSQLQLLPRTSEEKNWLEVWGAVFLISSCCLLWQKKVEIFGKKCI